MLPFIDRPYFHASAKEKFPQIHLLKLPKFWFDLTDKNLFDDLCGSRLLLKDTD